MSTFNRGIELALDRLDDWLDVWGQDTMGVWDIVRIREECAARLRSRAEDDLALRRLCAGAAVEWLARIGEPLSNEWKGVIASTCAMVGVDDEHAGLAAWSALHAWSTLRDERDRMVALAIAHVVGAVLRREVLP